MCVVVARCENNRGDTEGCVSCVGYGGNFSVRSAAFR